MGAVELVWRASPAVASAFGGGEAMLAVWSLASHSPIHGRMREAIAASRIAQKSLNLCNNARTMIDIAKAGGGIGIFPQPLVRGQVASGALAPIAGMPALAPVGFHVAMRVAHTEPGLTQILRRAAKSNPSQGAEKGKAGVK